MPWIGLHRPDQPFRWAQSSSASQSLCSSKTADQSLVLYDLPGLLDCAAACRNERKGKKGWSSLHRLLEEVPALVGHDLQSSCKTPSFFHHHCRMLVLSHLLLGPSSLVTCCSMLWSDLHRLLLEALPKGTVHFSHKVTLLEQEDKGVCVTAETPGGSVVFHSDIVIAADGVGSFARKQLVPGDQRRYCFSCQHM